MNLTLFLLQFKKKTKQQPNCLKRANISVVLIFVFAMSIQTSTLMLFAFFTVAVHESGTRKATSWSVTAYNKTVSSQCDFTSQSEG
jgi:hypothetical protein